MKLSEAIPDNGLRMGALDRLLASESITTELLTAALARARAAIEADEECWADEDGERVLAVDECADELLQHGLDALAHIEVDPAQLAEITTLSFDGGNEIYMWFEEAVAELLGLESYELDTGGESDLYLVRSFDGLAAMPGLQALNLDAYGWLEKARDASPLRHLSKLETLNLMNAKFDNAAVLLELPALRQLRHGEGLDPQLLAGLRERGVEVE